MRPTIVVLVGLGLAGCTGLPATGPDANGGTTIVVDAVDDTCGLATWSGLVGAGVDEALAGLLPLTTGQPPRARVIFPGQPMTMDYRADRLNVEIGIDDRVRRVYCG